MKLNYIISVVCILMAGEVMAQTPDGSNRPTAIPVPMPAAYTNTSVNFVRTWDPAIPTSDTAVVTATARTTAEVKMVTSYVDGLGRQIQSVSKGISPLGRDLVSPIVYDSFGREHFKYLPYVQQSANVSDGKFKTSPFTAQKAFYQDTVLNPGMSRESIYYGQTDFEASAFSRPLNVYSPGNSWAKEGGNHPTRHIYAVNDLSDSVRIWGMSGTNPVSSGIYPKAMLRKHTLIDEQNGQTVEFIDKEEHVILSKKLVGTASAAHAGWLCTYYVYDDLGNLRVILSPMAVQKGMTSAWNVSTVLDELCFQYQYDERKRLIVEKMPGKGADYKVYDVRDRLVFSQSASQRLKSPQEWFMTNYDGQDRPVMTALYRSNSSRQTLQDNLMNAGTSQTISYSFPIVADLVLNSYDGSPAYKASNSVTIGPSFETSADIECNIEIDASSNNGTTVISPTNFLAGIDPADITPLSYTYYDNYGYAGQLPYEAADFSKPQAGANPYAETLPTTPSTHTKGLVTGTKVRVLGTNQWITTSFYFDQKGFEIQRVADNQMGGKDVLTTLYDFRKNVLSTYLRHRNPRSAATPQTTVLTMVTYDHAGRTTAVRKRLNDDATQERTIVSNTFDEIGQLRDKRLNGTGASQLDMLTYTYNVRGWIQGINKAYVNSSGTGNWFGEEINYDYGFTSKQYNGSIAGVKWKTGSNNITRAYGFSYDQANRLAKADFRQQNTTGAAWTADKADFSVSNLTYDLNGNIQGIKQMGLNGTAVTVVDQLTYKYRNESNKLLSVTDAVNVSAAKLGDFNNGTNTGNDYTYDTTGNVTSDLNKGISNIIYNHLLLPESIAMTGKGTISYLYDAAGNKLKKTVTDSTLSTPRITETYYAGDFVYNQDTLQLFTHEEGRVRFLYDSAVPRYTYDYFEKDHLGNIRVVLGTSTATKVYAATMEAASAATENALFSNIDATRADLPAGYPSDGTTNNNKHVARLNAQNGKKVGPSLVLKVMAGDTVRIGVKAFYKSNGTNVAKSTAEDMLTAMMQSLTGNAEAEGMHGQASSGSGAASLLSASDFNSLKRKDPSQNLENKPKAYLNYILFDDQFKMVNENSGVRQVQSNPDEMSTLSVDGTVVKQSGFMYVYTSNESAENVYFDNLIVTQAVGPLLEETHYYPFGLTMSGISSKAPDVTVIENRYRFNGIEFENKEFSDGSGLEMYDTDFRQLDPQTGRWWQMDPRPQYNSSPYVAMMNNPVLYADPMGDTTWVFGTSGQFLGVVNDNLPNQVHFIDNSDPKTAPFDASKLSLEDANNLGQAIRDASVAFMGSKTAAQLQHITEVADKLNKEIAFVGKIGEDKEIELVALPMDQSNTVNRVDIIDQVDKKYPTAEEQSKIFLVGHIHTTEAGRQAGLSQPLPTLKENLFYLGEPTKGHDYSPVLYRSPTATEKGQSIALVATHYGVTIYGTGATYSNKYGPLGTVTPRQKSGYLTYPQVNGKTGSRSSLPNATLTIPKN